MTTLKSIAQKLDVSISLVSRVLNNRMGTTGARPELIEAIRHTAEEMGYQKNTSAAAVRNGRHNAIGIFLHNYGRPGSGNFDSLFRGIAMEARRRNQRFTLDFIEADEEFMLYADVMKKTTMDGVLLGGIPHEEAARMLGVLTASKMPVVTIFDKAINPHVPNIGIDQIEAGRMATEHLIRQGCRQIAHVTDFEDRYRGYCEALQQYEIPFSEHLIYRENGPEFSFERGQRAARYFMGITPKVDGVFAQSDEEATAIMHEFMEHGIRVPQDVRIIGVDNAPYCRFSRVPLSSVSQRGVEIGQEAVDMLLSLIDGNPVSSVVTAPMLCVRESTR